MRGRNIILSICGLLAVQTVDAQSCQRVPMRVDRLPSLTTPRTYHHTLYINEEVVVVGGHTNGFVPVKTAEYLSDGQWHEVPMVYTHDDGLAVQLRSGKVLVAGGYEKDFGIGQSYAAELYDPVAHRFESVSILDTRRAQTAGIEVDSGRVVVSGNWYHTDAIEQFDGRQFFAPVKEVVQPRCHPYLFLTAADDVMVVGSGEPHGALYDTIWVDRLRGEPDMPPLLQQWRPVKVPLPFQPQISFIGDESHGRYDYLMPVADSTGQVAIMQVRNGDFSLLQTDHPVPAAGWFSPVIADRQRQRAYLVGAASTGDSLYVLQIDYTLRPARLTLHTAERPANIGSSTPVLTPDGNLFMAGGPQFDNFHLCSGVVVLRVCDGDERLTASAPWWPWLLGGVFLAAAVIGLVFYRHRSHSSRVANSVEPSDADVALMQRINDLMERDRLYLNSGLKVSDIADSLGVANRRVSDSIKASLGISFAQFVNAYRVEYAQQLLLGYPDIKIACVWTGAGFATETSFFRTFKAVTGMAPKEWLEQNK